TALSEVPSTNHPLGFRGGGEGGITPALGVILNAIVDALSDLGVTHIDQPVALSRTAAGEIVALEDRCCHRFAPLSMGRLEGDELRCMYHGLKFASDGRCTEIP